MIAAIQVGKPQAQALSSTSALVVWDGDPGARYTLHCQKYECDGDSLIDSEDYLSENTFSVFGLSHCVDGLVPGCSYIFKVSNSPASAPLLLPLPTPSNEYDASRYVGYEFLV